MEVCQAAEVYQAVEVCQAVEDRQAFSCPGLWNHLPDLPGRSLEFWVRWELHTSHPWRGPEGCALVQLDLLLELQELPKRRLQRQRPRVEALWDLELLDRQLERLWALPWEPPEHQTWRFLLAAVQG